MMKRLQLANGNQHRARWSDPKEAFGNGGLYDNGRAPFRKLRVLVDSELCDDALPVEDLTKKRLLTELVGCHCFQRFATQTLGPQHQRLACRMAPCRGGCRLKTTQ